MRALSKSGGGIERRDRKVGKEERKESQCRKIDFRTKFCDRTSVDTTE
jgi:hypothetical protein